MVLVWREKVPRPIRPLIAVAVLAIIFLINVAPTGREAAPTPTPPAPSERVSRPIREGRGETATREKEGVREEPPSADADPADEKVAALLESVVHVTHTHTSSGDGWLAAFDALERHGRNASRLGQAMRYVVCTDRDVAGLSKWPWLEVVEYGDGNASHPLLYPGKVVNCVREVVRRHGPKVVLHTMEDMIPIGPIRWELVAAGARMLAASPEARFFRFGCVTGIARQSENCRHLIDQGFNRTITKRARNPPNIGGMRQCGDCGAGYTGVHYTMGFAIVPMLVRPGEFIAFHQEHVDRKSDSGSRMETWAHQHPEEKAGVGLQGFCDGSNGHADHRFDSHRRFAYPYIHSGVQFGMWMSADFAEAICPALEAQGIKEAGAMDCKADRNATPPCLCDDVTACKMEDGTTLRKFFKPPNRALPFPDGCASWRAKGRPGPKPVSPVGPAIERALRDEGLWEESGLDEAWGSL